MGIVIERENTSKKLFPNPEKWNARKLDKFNYKFIIIKDAYLNNNIKKIEDFKKYIYCD